jgi:hypothetical protein
MGSYFLHLQNWRGLVLRHLSLMYLGIVGIKWLIFCESQILIVHPSFADSVIYFGRGLSGRAGGDILVWPILRVNIPRFIQEYLIVKGLQAPIPSVVGAPARDKHWIQIALIMWVVIKGTLVFDRLMCSLARLLGHLALRSVDLAVELDLCDILLLPSCGGARDFGVCLLFRHLPCILRLFNVIFMMLCADDLKKGSNSHLLALNQIHAEVVRGSRLIVLFVAR